MAKRQRYSAEFKAKVALEAIREDLTTAELAKNTISTMIIGWKRAVIENMALAFSTKAAVDPTVSVADVEKLHAQKPLKVRSVCYAGEDLQRHGRQNRRAQILASGMHWHQEAYR